MRPIGRLTLFLCCPWIATVLYGEMVAYWVPLWTCSWPMPTPSDGQILISEKMVHIAVIADPQLADRTSYGHSSKSSALKAIQFYTDVYISRAFHSSILPFKPQMVIFLGDHFDGGPYLSDEEWHESLVRFKHIFGLTGRVRNSGIDVRYLSGNHDVGYSSFHYWNPKVMRRYEEAFGPRNYNFSVGKVDFIAIDAQTLDGPSQGSYTLSSWNFVESMSTDDPFRPRVLLTHIPLYRPDGTSCGQHRSSPIIDQRIVIAEAGRGLKYQNYLSEQTSDRLLDLLKPKLVLSGHDHDQCRVIHMAKHGLVPEHTLGTVSWQQGNLYPSFMLLSVYSMPSSNLSNSGEFLSAQLCFLPKQTHIYVWYIILFVMTLIILSFWPKNGLQCQNWWANLITITGRILGSGMKTGTKAKDEDECEYEMIWDAEGSMHLVKKSSKKGLASEDNLCVSSKGTAVLRPTAKKHQITSEEEADFLVGMETDVAKSDELVRGQGLTMRKTKFVELRIMRVLQSVLFIASVNVPLYTMLLFKDWIHT